ncbi:hypothetical protein [Acetobacter orleanensis]|uniref:Uncharacterized protein n=1 Tax=Acetobacter orleanensis TaxID=104099 RepID=A0A4Y3TNA8_9PROT|nr:hypothetical protein [Acetobacter orleanensis]PCD78720.1 hypothetical protein CO710_11030 [Acetobacter orleanensis]GAN67373.1 hypothetical protein Abol_002_039 [Acetobacter orleanensis JCM 7639]GBR23664.1 hypothetical protein AA0473_0434 [Acetobacter orleanensis NRIC 0473]GEB83342.1 hypothetical protein AOR01nite_18190 [Acetobacter orleanensis]
MTRSPVYLTDLACSERLTIWTIRRLAGTASCCQHARNTTPASLFMPCFRQDFLAVADAFHDTLTQMAALEAPSLDIRSGSTLAITPTEYSLLLATEAAQNEQDLTVHALLKPLGLFPNLLERLTNAITTLGACLAGAGYWLSHHAARPVTPTPATLTATLRKHPTTAAALSLTRWHDFDITSTPISWPQAGRHTAVADGGLSLPH